MIELVGLAGVHVSSEQRARVKTYGQNYRCVMWLEFRSCWWDLGGADVIRRGWRLLSESMSLMIYR